MPMLPNTLGQPQDGMWHKLCTRKRQRFRIGNVEGEMHYSSTMWDLTVMQVNNTFQLNVQRFAEQDQDWQASAKQPTRETEDTHVP